MSAQPPYRPPTSPPPGYYPPPRSNRALRHRRRGARPGRHRRRSATGWAVATAARQRGAERVRTGRRPRPCAVGRGAAPPRRASSASQPRRPAAPRPRLRAAAPRRQASPHPRRPPRPPEPDARPRRRSARRTRLRLRQDGHARAAGRTKLTFDRATLLTGAAAASAAKAHGQTVEDDYFIVNDNPLIRTFTVSPDGRRRRQPEPHRRRRSDARRPCSRSRPGSAAHKDQPLPVDLAYDAKGTVVKITEVFFP